MPYARLDLNICSQLYILFLGAVKCPLMLSQQTRRNNECYVLSCVTVPSSVEAARGPTSQHRALDHGLGDGRFHVEHYANEKSVYPKDVVL